MEGKRQELFFDYFFPSNFTVVLSDHKQSHFQSFNLLYHNHKNKQRNDTADFHLDNTDTI